MVVVEIAIDVAASLPVPAGTRPDGNPLTVGEARLMPVVVDAVAVAPGHEHVVVMRTLARRGYFLHDGG